MQELSTRKLTLSYVIALTIIASLSLSSSLTFSRVLKQHQGSAALINICGRQGMLSQRIASLASQLALGDESVRTDLISAIDQLETAAHDLAYGDGKDLPELSPRVRSIYFEGSHPLYQQITDYLKLARRIAGMKAGDPALRNELAPLLEAARKPLFTGFDVVVGLRELESEDRLSYLQWIQAMTLAGTLATLAVEAILIFRPMIRRIAEYAKNLLLLATTDPLTGLLNRRSFMSRAASEIMRRQRMPGPMTAMMVDADHFKKVNDTYGHDAGDAVLKALATALQNGIRETDILARFGGEEFALLLPGVDVDGACELAGRLLREIAALVIWMDQKPIRFTVSIGVAGAGEKAAIDLMLKSADEALYLAKTSGRNRWMVAP
jgi:diguanylate cyclase (GGDEF)-like protein